MTKFKLKKVPATTNNITKGIVGFIHAQGHSASRVNTTGIWDEKRKAFRRSGSRSGFYDICATIRTRFKTDHLQPIGLTLMIEVKRGRDELSAAQIEFRTEIQECGGRTFESKNYDDFVEYWNTIIKPQYL